jgi:hypothetical protein
MRGVRASAGAAVPAGTTGSGAGTAACIVRPCIDPLHIARLGTVPLGTVPLGTVPRAADIGRRAAAADIGPRVVAVDIVPAEAAAGIVLAVAAADRGAPDKALESRRAAAL